MGFFSHNFCAFFGLSLSWHKATGVKGQVILSLLIDNCKVGTPEYDSLMLQSTLMIFVPNGSTNPAYNLIDYSK